jgi:membrane-anchored protein YejM (alkaline phosphatase superfamily)
MARKIVGWLVLVPLCVVLVAFALANRHLVAVNINPFAPPAEASMAGYGVPLFVVLYLVLLIGVLLGGTATWFAQGGHRRAEKLWRKEARHLNNELESERRRHGQPGKAAISDVDEILDLH